MTRQTSESSPNPSEHDPSTADDYRRSIAQLVGLEDKRRPHSFDQEPLRQIHKALYGSRPDYKESKGDIRVDIANKLNFGVGRYTLPKRHNFSKEHLKEIFSAICGLGSEELDEVQGGSGVHKCPVCGAQSKSKKKLGDSIFHDDSLDDSVCMSVNDGTIVAHHH